MQMKRKSESQLGRSTKIYLINRRKQGGRHVLLLRYYEILKYYLSLRAE